jgi:hypothetical protein
MAPKHVDLNGFYYIIITLIQLCAFVSVNYSNLFCNSRKGKCGIHLLGCYADWQAY